MWDIFRCSNIKTDEKQLRDARKSLNVNEEYLSALRTKSYADFFTKAQLLVNQPSSPFSNHKFSETLLEPSQDTIPSILESAILKEVPQFKVLMDNYFDISAEASKICGYLLRNINQTQLNCKFTHQSLDKINNYCPADKVELINSFIIENNPFSNPNKQEFNLIHDKYSSFLHLIDSKRKKITRKIKFIKCVHKVAGVCTTAACGLVAITAIVIAAHTLAALLLAPVVFSFPIKSLKIKHFFSLKSLRSGILRKVRAQLDVAAKGTYIINRDFDTMSRLVSRLHDEVEHNKNMIQFWLDRSREARFSIQVVEELKRSNLGLKKQVEELEEHVYLCLVTINRARALVIKEMTNSC